MNNLTTFLNKMQLRKVLTAFVLGIILLITTACNNGDEFGARPNNPPVQMGGQNNPHKAGGDDYTQYKSPTAPMVKEAGNRASLRQSFDKAIAFSDFDKNSDGLLYPGASEAKSARSKDDFTSPKLQQDLNDPGQNPVKRQPIVKRYDEDSKLLEKAGQAFKDASEFLSESTKNIDDR
ncbi:hypothetical protein HC931_09185 [Candidatus Gracilibacteria bacterium]|nr:hypothetical protein [Candidatus Gracilibacteria bacterium]NJM88588.1 hypothetical protein [Hydrococcus sp. RU_2_2]NJP21313.1 hypothetical protein [Hydrococcus sp. CRU_1_1]NJQ97404.1 hypothetical protein [Hydrococcus sp. CSU_1_8]